MIPANLITVFLGFVIVFFLTRRLYRKAMRKRLLDKPFPEDYKQIVEKNVPLYNYLPYSLKQQLHGLINIFVTEKHFEGCGGLEINDEIRITVAAQACMLLLNRKTSIFRRLHTILVYPYTYVAKTMSSDGTFVIEDRSVRLGESWQNGPVVLAWDSIKGGTSNITDARNVVLHEFAHQLDQEDGAADGAPILEHRTRYVTWARVLSREYEKLQTKKRKGQRAVIDEYGATNPAEFFAVATETFFEKSKQLKKRHPELYQELKNYYKLDPVQWLENQ